MSRTGILFGISMFLLLAYWGDAVNVTFVVCMSYTSLAYSYDYYGPAIDVAMQEMELIYPDFDFNKVNLSPKRIHTCADLDANILDLVTEYIYNNENGTAIWKDPENLLVIVANGCSQALKYITDLGRDLNIVVIASGGSDSELANQERFPTLLRLLPYQQNDLVEVMLLFLKKYTWTDVTLLCDTNPALGNFFALACSGFEDGITNTPKSTLTKYLFNSVHETDQTRWLVQAAARSRVILIVAHGNITRQIMITAHRLGMTQGDFVYVTTYPLEHPLYGYYKWQFWDDDDEDAKQAFRSLYFVSTKPIRGPQYASFEVEIKYRSYKQYNHLYEEGEKVSAFTALQHTLIHFIGKLVNETLYVQRSIKDGAFAIRRANMPRIISSVTGDFAFENGDRKSYVYVIVTMNHHTSGFTEVLSFNTDVDQDLVPVPQTQIQWAYRDSPPPNVPFCGYDGLDPRCDSSRETTITIVFSICAGIIILTVAGYFIAKYTKNKGDEDPRWYVPYNDIEFPKANPISNNGNLSTASYQNMQRSDAGSQMKSHSSWNNSKTVSPSVGSNGTGEKSPHVVKYKDKSVWARQRQLLHKFSPTLQQEGLIRKMKRLHHTNIAQFYGMCPQGLDMIFLCEFCSRGSLYDVINGETVTFDASLKNSVISDLTNAMVFLHDSPVGYHGSLSVTTCLLNSRFVVKVGYFRLDFLPYLIPDFMGNEDDYRQFLTFPPEQLRGPIVNIFHGSREGDVYSYAYILAQIMTGMEPFEQELQEKPLASKDIFEKLVEEKLFPYRQQLSTDIFSLSLLRLVEKCWEDKPVNRPSFRVVERYLKAIPGFDKDENFMDSLFKRMAGYAEELEIRISQTTAGMMEEKKKSEELLFQVLPRHLATALTQGKKIEPEGFESVTIGFTALANFFTVALESTPLQIVDLLNDLYSMFDAALELFDVYKVETISDSYMIASGLPVRNGHEHSRQIAKLSLNLMKESENFKIRHRPTDKLKLKIGFHSGKCAAGIVGLKMPRYCLFGDTINTASRMVSFGMSRKIQISTSAKQELERFSEFRFGYRGLVEIKGKGLQRCYWLLQEHENPEDYDEEPKNYK